MSVIWLKENREITLYNNFKFDLVLLRTSLIVYITRVKTFSFFLSYF